MKKFRAPILYHHLKLPQALAFSKILSGKPNLGKRRWTLLERFSMAITLFYLFSLSIIGNRSGTGIPLLLTEYIQYNYVNIINIYISKPFSNSPFVQSLL